MTRWIDELDIPCPSTLSRFCQAARSEASLLPVVAVHHSILVFSPLPSSDERVRMSSSKEFVEFENFEGRKDLRLRLAGREEDGVGCTLAGVSGRDVVSTTRYHCEG